MRVQAILQKVDDIYAMQSGSGIIDDGQWTMDILIEQSRNRGIEDLIQEPAEKVEKSCGYTESH